MSEARALSDDERRALACVLDELIPPAPERRLPGAGEIGLTAHMERLAAELPAFRAALLPGLAALAELAQQRGAPGFAALRAEERLAALSELAASQPAFVPNLVFQTYVAYYREGPVLEALGLEARPPHPKGHQLAPLDPARLDAVRARPPLYRKA
jgi:hypothetical protein